MKERVTFKKKKKKKRLSIHLKNILMQTLQYLMYV